MFTPTSLVASNKPGGLQQAWRPPTSLVASNKPGGLDGLRGVWLALLILLMDITPELTTKQSKIRTLDHALTTITHHH
jgi:hypothetical protein